MCAMCHDYNSIYWLHTQISFLRNTLVAWPNSPSWQKSSCVTRGTEASCSCKYLDEGFIQLLFQIMRFIIVLEWKGSTNCGTAITTENTPDNKNSTQWRQACCQGSTTWQDKGKQFSIFFQENFLFRAIGSLCIYICAMIFAKIPSSNQLASTPHWCSRPSTFISVICLLSNKITIQSLTLPGFQSDMQYVIYIQFLTRWIIGKPCVYLISCFTNVFTPSAKVECL